MVVYPEQSESPGQRDLIRAEEAKRKDEEGISTVMLLLVGTGLLLSWQQTAAHFHVVAARMESSRVIRHSDIFINKKCLLFLQLFFVYYKRRFKVLRET